MSRPPHDWVPALMRLLGCEPAVVRVVIAEARGSVPREPGAFMLVGRVAVEGTIGGGRLEWESIAAARDLLNDVAASARLSRIVLAADVGQCCGGVVSIWLERFTAEDLGLLRLAKDAGAHGPAVLRSTIKGSAVEREVATDVSRGGELVGMPRWAARPRIAESPGGGVTFLQRLDDALPALWLYGAGHVGQALARILTELPLGLTWIDSRRELFPAGLSSEVRLRCEPDSLATVPDAPAGAHFLVMTHSHALDYELVRGILARNDFAWLGLIGSRSKAARFRSRLAREGIASDRLVCPIGVAGIESKWPAAIAVAVAAQLLHEISAGVAHDGECSGVAAGVGAASNAEPDVAPDVDAAKVCGQESCATCGARGRRLE